MSKSESLEELGERSWADIWEHLPQSEVAYERASEPTQLTIRLNSGAVQALKRIALKKRLQYGPLARSWIAEGCQDVHVPATVISESDDWAASDEQLNIKVDANLLQRLKDCASRLRLPYHRLARLWIYERISQEQSSPAPASQSPSLKEILLVLLHSKGPRGLQDESVRGVTRLVKLLFVASERTRQSQAALFYAYHYGPFNDEVYDLVRALESEGLVAGTTPSQGKEPSFEDMMRVLNKKGSDQPIVPVYRLTQKGSAAADALVQHRPYGKPLSRVVESIKRDYGSLSDEELIERVYSEFPEYTDKSLIADEVRQRAKRRHRGT